MHLHHPKQVTMYDNFLIYEFKGVSYLKIYNFGCKLFSSSCQTHRILGNTNTTNLLILMHEKNKIILIQMYHVIASREC